MTEQLTAPQFTIETATEADVSGIGQAHLQSILETYPNEEAGIDRDWINQRLGFLTDPAADEFRRGTVRESETNPEHVLYLVAKNIRDEVVGFVHVTRGEEQSKLEAIYLVEEARGEGVADDLMRRGLKFAGDLPMTLQVLDYNTRAIRFYEKYGFELIPDSYEVIRDKMPVFSMLRKPSKEVKS